MALMKMKESWLRCRVLGVGCCDWLESVSDDEDGVDGSCVENSVLSGRSIWWFARGDCGKPTGVDCVKHDICMDLMRLELNQIWRYSSRDVLRWKYCFKQQLFD